MGRRKIVAGNWKMNLSPLEAVELANALKAAEATFKCDVAVYPPYVYLPQVQQVLQGSSIAVGAQNCSQFSNGAYTGEVSCSMLTGLGVKTVLVGHSERREYFAETHNVLREKLLAAILNNLKAVFCCGEPLAIRQAGTHEAYVKKQLEESLFALTDEQMLNISVAYEPVWAIGTGLNATPEQAQQMHAFIRGLIAGRYGSAIALSTRILYGGSCKPDNAANLFSCPDVDGGLIGGASLKATDFIAIIEKATL